METKTSRELFREAQEHMPGGVNSPVRAFKSVGGDPLFISHASGSKITDADGNEYIDYVGSWGPMILGHAHPRVTEAIREAAGKGTSFGTCCEDEIRLAELVKKMVPSIELIRMVNSGTEATMSAMRLARGFTGREKIIKFEGCYHGHGDSFLSKAGSGVVTLGLPDSPGVTVSTAKDTLNAVYNDIDSVNRLLEENKGAIAAIFIEPVAGNMGCVPADAEFLAELRRICTDEGILLVFDEVMSGFRVARGGAQEIYGVEPDLTTFGKIIGGGLPVGAYGGRRDVMEMIAPSGPVYQAGTMSGNPLAMAAGIAALTVINEDPAFYEDLASNAALLFRGLSDALDSANIPFTLNSCGSMFTLFFAEGPVTDFTSAKTSDTGRFNRYFHAMLDGGVYLPPSQFEANFVSASHSQEDLALTTKILHDAAEKGIL